MSTNPTAPTRSLLDLSFSRRNLLIGAGLGGATLGGMALLSGCAPTSAGSTTASFAAYEGDMGQQAFEAVMTQFAENTGFTINKTQYVNADFRAGINTWLQGSPEDVFQWSAGYRMRYYADRGLVAPIDDIWEGVGGNFSEGMANAVTARDGSKYMVPANNYPWAFYYRASVWEERGYQEPVTWDEFIALCKQMQSDGLIPINFPNKDGWQAQGTFDYINMRTNGYQFHVDLCAHEESWDQPKVAKVFDYWRELLPFQDPNSLGLTFDEGTAKLANSQAGMWLMGTFFTQGITDQAILDDLRFFLFPEIEVEAREAIEAPLDGFMLSNRGGENEVARSFVEYLGTKEATDIYFSIDTSLLPVLLDADRSGLSELNRAGAEAIAQAKNISAFFDRDALPTMANNVVIPALQGFIGDGTIDLRGIEAQAVTLYAAE